MFHSTHHLPQRLSPEHYTSPDICQQEINAMFLPGWHCLGGMPDAPKVGDFLTGELFGNPLICWHTEHGYRTYLNICTHRFCTLTDKARGRFDGKMKCQYHGWEFDEGGNTCKIPDAQHFRPLKKGELGLREFRTEVIGQLIFVTLNDDAPSLEEFLGPQIVEWCRKNFSLQHRLTSRYESTIDCNWKIIVENVMESYHLACIHKSSFGVCPDAEDCQHEFHPTYDYYQHDASHQTGNEWMLKLAAKVTGREQEPGWQHFVRYPNVVFGGAGPWHFVQMVYPLGPSQCRNVLYTMHDSGPRGKFWPFLLHRVLMRIGSMATNQIQAEDGAVYPSIQRGIASPLKPHGGGLISAREERIFTFQDYVLKALRSGDSQNVAPTPPERAEESQPLVAHPV